LKLDLEYEAEVDMKGGDAKRANIQIPDPT
jgi:hypothetical protein